MAASHEVLQAATGNSIDKKTFLIASMRAKASTLRSDLLAPDKVSDAKVSYETMKKTLQDHLVSQRLEMAERYTFYTASQQPNENASEFFSRLKKLSEHCNFGGNLDSMLRDRLVLGCRSPEARKRLLQFDPLTLKTVQDTLSVFEAVEDARNVLHDHPVTMEVDTGAAVSFISESIWRSMGSPNLPQCTQLFSAYDGHRLKPLGDLQCTLDANGLTITSKITVVKSFKSYRLLGRDLMHTFLDRRPIDSVVSVVERLSAMKIKPVSINICGTEILKFCKPRPILSQ